MEEKSIIEVLKSIGEINIQEDNGYDFKENKVPRVTQIISQMMHEDYIAYWANSLGFKRISYSVALREAAEKGTYTHNAIEKYLSKGIYPNTENLPPMAVQSVENAFSGFLCWYDIIKKNNTVDVIFAEKKLVCKYFGGTLDCLLKIGDKIWLIDFKTTNHVYDKHFLQLAAYRYMLDTVLDIQVDGCLILQLNKSAPSNFKEYILDFSVNDHLCFINKCQETFMSLVYAYYNRIQVECDFKNIFGGRKK